jgi:hypothetical protein
MRCDRKLSAMIFADAQKLETAALLAWNSRRSEKRERSVANVRVGQRDLPVACRKALRLLPVAFLQFASRIAPGFRALASAER